jgi:hypothetical protein
MATVRELAEVMVRLGISQPRYAPTRETAFELQRLSLNAPQARQ